MISTGVQKKYENIFLIIKKKIQGGSSIKLIVNKPFSKSKKQN